MKNNKLYILACYVGFHISAILKAFLWIKLFYTETWEGLDQFYYWNTWCTIISQVTTMSCVVQRKNSRIALKLLKISM